MYGLKELADFEGFESVDEMLDEGAFDSVCPAICPECGYTTQMEPDQDRGWCENCQKNTVKSALILAGLISAEYTGLSPELESPVRLEAAGKPIDTDIGHAAPFVCDFDGDGVKDLLVGQFGGGILWIYLNEGTNSQPKLTAGVKFKDGKEDGRVPSG